MDALASAINKAKRRQALPAPAARRALRQRLGLSQQDLAKALRVSHPSIARYELGQRTPRGDVLERYLQILHRLAQEQLGT